MYVILYNKSKTVEHISYSNSQLVAEKLWMSYLRRLAATKTMTAMMTVPQMAALAAIVILSM